MKIACGIVIVIAGFALLGPFGIFVLCGVIGWWLPESDEDKAARKARKAQFDADVNRERYRQAVRRQARGFRWP